MKALLLTVGLAGCVPRGPMQHATVEPTLGPLVVERTHPIKIKTDMVDHVMVVRATWPRMCRREVSGAEAPPVRRTCHVPAAGAPLLITFGSGRMLPTTADRTGALLVIVPDNEASDEVRVTAPDALPPAEMPHVQAPLEPATPGPVSSRVGRGMGGVRDVVLQCGRGFGITGSVRLRVRVRGGVVTATLDHVRTDFMQCVQRELAAVEFPRDSSLETTIEFLVAKP